MEKEVRKQLKIQIAEITKMLGMLNGNYVLYIYRIGETEKRERLISRNAANALSYGAAMRVIYSDWMLTIIEYQDNLSVEML